MTPRRLPNGWIVIGGSVLASFIWWMASRPSNAVAPAPAPAAAPAPVEATPAAEAPANPSPSSSKSRASTEAPAPEPPPEPAPEASPQLPLLRVVGDVAGANVFLDRKYVGKTPFETRDVTAGGHQINVSAEGYDGMSRHVEVASEGPTEVTFSLKAVVLESAVQVVHRHRLGSCEGRLSADLAGLRYAPTSGDDGFHAPLGGVQTLAVDYKEKMLRLKLKSGKSFNFTTKAANADPLLVFHRDVEKARKKVAGGA
jgi:PEGA domain